MSVPPLEIEEKAFAKVRANKAAQAAPAPKPPLLQRIKQLLCLHPYPDYNHRTFFVCYSCGKSWEPQDSWEQFIVALAVYVGLISFISLLVLIILKIT